LCALGSFSCDGSCFLDIPVSCIGNVRIFLCTVLAKCFTQLEALHCVTWHNNHSIVVVPFDVFRSSLFTSRGCLFFHARAAPHKPSGCLGYCCFLPCTLPRILEGDQQAMSSQILFINSFGSNCAGWFFVSEEAPFDIHPGIVFVINSGVVYS